MKVNDFNYHLPHQLIAQHPTDKRDHSRLLVLDKQTGEISHHHFYDILDFLNSNDVLVINNTKVLPARLLGIKEETDAVIEVLLLKEVEPHIWEVMTKPARRVKVGTNILFSNLLRAECIQVKEEGLRIFKMHYEGLFIEILEQLGTMPLPPYITEKLMDRDRYQTVYAKDLGSAAAPTAGLHFTDELLTKIKQKGIEIIPITLHVGLGTFKPVQVDEVEKHLMHEETYTISHESAKRLNEAVRLGKRIVPVGTTSVRTLESNFQDIFRPGTFETSIFIYPGYQFKVINTLITNFHLPKSTLLMLTSALATKKHMMLAYQEAIAQNYRFFSFGDAMFIK
ncbi:MAG: tRNA preQ1(34) S-adenosylmethionine ribosyltransferase-isomerase QueA [Acholeplasmataceae bacterium]